MGAPDYENLQKIAAAIDQVHDELFAQRDLGFINAAEKKEFYFERVKRGDRRWNRTHVCMYPSCTSRSIKRSHTLPRSGPLERIAENGHVITVEFDRARGSLAAAAVGVREASTFPGFCVTHEGMFRGFEQNKELRSPIDHVLQFFRIVCREIRIRESQATTMRELATDHRLLLNRRGTELLKKKLGDEFVRAHKLGNLEFQTINEWHANVLSRIEDLEGRIEDYRMDFFEPLRSEIEGTDHVELTMLSFSTNVETPVCLGGRGNFYCQSPEGKRETIVFGQVWPSAAGTQVTLLARADHHDDLATYVNAFVTRPLGLLSLIESWMVHGTDHWFVQPSAWNALSTARQQQLFDDIMDDSRNIGSEYPFSIFDSIRTSVSALHVPKDVEEADQIEQELQKVERSRSITHVRA